MKTDHLPTVTHVYAHPRRAAFLRVSAGPDVSIIPTDRVLFVPALGVVSVHGKGYRVPVALFAAVRGALGLEGLGA